MALVGPLTKKFLKNFLHNRVSSRKYPFFGSIEVTRRCNSNCSFCPIGSEKREMVEGEMTTEEIKTVLDQFAEMNIIAFSYLGGEPTLRKDVVEIAEHARSLNIASELTTNGLLLADRAEEYSKALDAMVISIDTTDPERYREIRGVDGFDRVVEGIKEAVRFSEDTGANIITNTVLCAANLDEVEDIVRFTHSLGVDGMMFDFATFHDYWKDIVDKDRSRYDPDRMDWRKDTRRVREAVQRLIELKERYPIITSKSYLRTFLSGDLTFRCHPYLFVCVDKVGKVALPCFDSKVTRFYDIVHEHRLKDLWFSEEARELRERVKSCSICYMHCIVEPSKVLGEPMRNLGDLMEWIRTFRSAKKINR